MVLYNKLLYSWQVIILLKLGVRGYSENYHHSQQNKHGQHFCDSQNYEVLVAIQLSNNKKKELSFFKFNILNFFV